MSEQDFERNLEERSRRLGNAALDHPYRTGTKALVAIVALVVIVALISDIGHWAFGWFNGAAEVTGFQNTKQQYGIIISDYEGLKAAARNACRAEDAAKANGSPTLVEDPAMAYEATYERIAVDYNTHENDVFQGGLVGPGGYPKHAPSLEAMQAQVC